MDLYPKQYEPPEPLRRLTLLELIIVIFIIGVLLALLLPAGGHSRDISHRMTCNNQLKMLGLALHNYHDTYGHFPAAICGTDLDGDPLASNAGRLSGVVDLLPFLELTSTYDQIHAPMTVNGTEFPVMGPAPWNADYPPWQLHLEALRCPGAYRELPEPGRTNYAFCVGDMARDLHTVSLPGQHVPKRGVFGGYGFTRLKEITDGTSNTIMMGEIGSPALRRVRGQYVTQLSASILDHPSLHQSLRSPADAEVYDARFSLSKLGRGGRWADGSAGSSQFNTILPPNSPSCAIDGDEAADGIYSLGSLHAGGAQIVFADGSTRFIPETIDCGDLSQAVLTRDQFAAQKLPSPFGVWGALGTATDGETIPAEY